MVESAGEDNLFRRVTKSGMLGSGALVFAASMGLNIGSFVFHAIASRKLGVADYGGFYALISLYFLAATPALLFGPVITKFSAEFRALHDDAHLRGLVQLIAIAFGIIGVVYIVVGIVFAAPLGGYLHVPSWAIPIVGFLVAMGLLSSALRAIGQGTHDFFNYAWSVTAEGVAKVVALLLLAIGTLTIARSVAGFLIGVIVGLGVMAFPLVRRYGRVHSASIRLDWHRIWATTGGAAAMTVTSALIGYADIVLVKHYFPAQEAGLYSAASLGGKILLYVVGFVPIVLLPHATDRFARGERTRDTIFSALGFIAIAGIVGVVAFRFFGLYLLHALVGHEFDAALPLLTGYGTAMAVMAATNALASYGIATHRLLFAAPLLAGAAITLAAIALYHPVLSVVVGEMVAGNLLMFVLVSVSIGFQGMRSRA